MAVGGARINVVDCKLVSIQLRVRGDVDPEKLNLGQPGSTYFAGKYLVLPGDQPLGARTPAS